MKYFDVPKYKVRPRPGRFLFNRAILSIFVGIFVYVFIYVNYFLLDELIPTPINWLLIVGIVLFICIQLIWCYVKYGNYSYEFYEHKLIADSDITRSISFDELRHIHYQSNIIDRWFKTGSIILELKDGKSIKLKYLDNPNQAYTLMQRYVK